MFPSAVWLASIAAALLVPLFIFLLLRGKSRLAPRGNTVILCGPSGTGKTPLFLSLVTDRRMETTLSASANCGRLPNGMQICDIPGSAKVRNTLLESYLPSARSMILQVGEREDLSEDVPFVISVIAKCIQRRLPLLLILQAERGASARMQRESPTRAQKQALAEGLEGRLQDALDRYAVVHEQIDELADAAQMQLVSNVQCILRAVDFEQDPRLFSLSALGSVLDLQILSQPGKENVQNWICSK